ncbi:hypothetical protein MUY14_12515 [Amycolatopsis sp. FBCC-B4732]|uniref:hypothetical protein n=1 Tax=Amycolatopsis sp. FBCC-B4732 TaxID=3079339 RepID=UPI001FF1BD33|nr:hypothetical protein [Amycolatopsis sp. FBCC-B4732]UOX91402.1 hypothetical protein MUY14_12515 [Amycolatopsis sp. FBCC-B4732]
MNKIWARERLEIYLGAVRNYQAAIRSGHGFDQDAYEAVIKLEPAAKAIMKHVNPGLSRVRFRPECPRQSFHLDNSDYRLAG